MIKSEFCLTSCFVCVNVFLFCLFFVFELYCNNAKSLMGPSCPHTNYFLIFLLSFCEISIKLILINILCTNYFLISCISDKIN